MPSESASSRLGIGKDAAALAKEVFVCGGSVADNLGYVFRRFELIEADVAGLIDKSGFRSGKRRIRTQRHLALY